MNLLDLPNDLLGLIASSHYVGQLGCTMLAGVCSGMFPVVRENVINMSKVVILASASGYLDIVKMTAGNTIFSAENNRKWVYDVCTTAAENGHIEIIQWMNENECIHDLTASYAARGGQLAIIKWLHARGNKLLEVDQQAAENGHLNILEWLRDNNLQIRNHVPPAAAAHGHLDVIKWLHKNGFHMLIEHLIAAENGHINVYKWLYKQGYSSDALFILNVCCKFGHLNILKWLRKKGHECTRQHFIKVTIEGHFDIVKWIYHEFHPQCNNICDIAAENGRAEILEWLHGVGYPITVDTFTAAAPIGEFSIL